MSRRTAPRVERIGNATLYRGDCLELLPTLSGVDAIVTDPPYGLNYSPDGRKQIYNDSRRDFARLLRRLPDAILRSGTDRLAMFTRWDVWSQLCEHLADCYPPCNCAIWDKNDPGRGNCKHMGNSHEMVYISAPAGHEMRVGGKRPLNIVRAQKISPQKMVHPTEKPVEVMAYLVECMARPGELVCDPFMGSGATGVAAIRTGRRFVGIELDAEHFDTACRRIEAAWNARRTVRAAA